MNGNWQQTYLRKLQQLRTRVSRRRHNDFRIQNTRPGVLIVDMTSRFCTPCKLLFIYDKSKRTCLCLVKRKVLPKIFRILPELCWQSLP